MVKSNYILLSYPLSEKTPTFRDNPAPKIKVISNIDEGDVANVRELTTINHNGTHMDAPFHFNPVGKRITDIDINDLVFSAPLILDIPKEDAGLISAEDLRVHHDALQNCDLALVRTGWGHLYRVTDPRRYSYNAPGFHSDAGHYLLNETPVRALGIDTSSVASTADGLPLEEGMKFHQVVLRTGKEPGERYILLIEDVKLEPDLNKLNSVIIAPLYLQDADGAPVTILAEPV